ncbi:nucleotidyltransferase family protein [Cnuella takakiae]|nr:nucleotidyltransferase family protein [Cnuella takakiae]OLY91883.1 hypothetical protein BUE76_08210 [Cnuella takakiae]
MNTSQNIGVMLLAAGSSSRLGRPKQLLAYEGQSLLQHSLQVALEAGTGPVVVVLGAKADEVGADLSGEGVHTVFNPEWQEGMAASIRCGVRHLQQVAPSVEALILMVCDQPFVSPQILQSLVKAHQDTGKPIVTCTYAGTFGPPTLFRKSLFPQLLQLTGDVGARSILKQYANEVEALPFPEGKLDIDTENDYQQMLSGNRTA